MVKRAPDNPVLTLKNSLNSVNELKVQVEKSQLRNRVKTKMLSHLKSLGEALQEQLDLAQAVAERIEE